MGGTYWLSSEQYCDEGIMVPIAGGGASELSPATLRSRRRCCSLPSSSGPSGAV